MKGLSSEDLTMTGAREYFWGCELSKDNPSVTWSFEEEEEDTDFLMHTLFLKHAVLGSSAVKDERNIVEVETKNFDQQKVLQPFFSLTLGLNDVVTLDLSFGHETPVTFRLKDGAGPIYLSGQQLVEFPPEDADMSQEETEFEDTHIESEEEESPQKAKSKKRKAPTQGAAKSKKGKMEDEDEDEDESEEESEEEAEDEDEEEDMDDEDDEDFDENEVESSPEKGGKKKKKGKESAKEKAAGKKDVKPSKTAAKKAKKPAAKKGKK